MGSAILVPNTPPMILIRIAAFVTKDSTLWARRSNRFPTNNPTQAVHLLAIPTMFTFTKTLLLVLWGTLQ